MSAVRQSLSRRRDAGKIAQPWGMKRCLGQSKLPIDPIIARLLIVKAIYEQRIIIREAIQIGRLTASRFIGAVE